MSATVRIFFLVLIAGTVTAGCTGRKSHNRIEAHPFRSPVTFAVGEGPTTVLIGDFTNDGHPDLITCNSGSNTVTVLPGDGSGAFGEPITSPVAPQPFHMVMGEFTGDTSLDLAIIHSSTGLLTILRGTGDGRFQEFQRVSIEMTPTRILADDFNGDGHADLVVSLRLDRIMIFSGSGRGFFILTNTFDPGDTPTGLDSADLNKDGHTDLIVANNGNVGRSLAVFHGTGDGTFKKGPVKKTPLVPLQVRAADFSKDGVPDLAVVYGERNTLALFPGNADGTYGDPKVFGAEGGPADMVLGDFNDDGNLDLAVPNNLSHNLSIVFGKGDGSFSQPPVDYQTQKVPMSIAAGEIISGMPAALVVANNGSASVSVYLAESAPPPGAAGGQKP